MDKNKINEMFNEMLDDVFYLKIKNHTIRNNLDNRENKE
jgi:hypothetical protein